MPSTKSPSELQIVDAVSTTIARQFKPSGFIYDLLAPRIPVDVDAGKYPTFTRFFDDEVESKVSDRAQTPEIDFDWSTDSYLCEPYRLKVSISAKEKGQVHPALHLEQSKITRLMTSMAIRRERRLAAILRKTTNSGALNLGAGVSNKWNVDAATIEADIKTAKTGIYTASGMVPNTIVIPYLVATEIAVQQDIREILKYTVDGQKILIEGETILPAKLWGLDVIVPTGVVRNSAKEGATVSLAEIWSDNVIVCYRDRNPGWGIPSVAYSFEADPGYGFSPQGEGENRAVVDRWTENDPPVEYIRAWESLDEKVCAPDLGYEITDVL